jgi:hypothetical protein
MNEAELDRKRPVEMWRCDTLVLSKEGALCSQKRTESKGAKSDIHLHDWKCRDVCSHLSKTMPCLFLVQCSFAVGLCFIASCLWLVPSGDLLGQRMLWYWCRGSLNTDLCVDSCWSWVASDQSAYLFLFALISKLKMKLRELCRQILRSCTDQPQINDCKQLS